MKNSCLLHFTFLAVSVSSVVYAQNMELNTRSFSIAQAKIDAQGYSCPTKECHATLGRCHNCQST